MRPVGESELLSAWEHGLNQPVLQRALILITTAYPELDSDTVAALSIGDRDARLLQLREWMFGAQLLNTAQCPQCGARVEWQSRTTELRLQAVRDVDAPAEYTLDVDDYRLVFRLPTSMDIAAAMAAQPGDTDTGATALVKQCVVTAHCFEKACGLDDLPLPVIDALSRQIEELDPQADIRTALTCPECAHQWDVLFDITSFLWAEVDNWAERTLRTVHRLASAYGWSFSEILDLSPIRRQLFLGMVDR